MLRVIKANNEKYKLKKLWQYPYVSTWLKATEMEDNSEAADNKVGSNLHVKFIVFVLFERL